uniref:Microtubule-associated protein Jupiter n=1 Tax=Anopheles albimanus TaxID=7167 RepID=A0A182F927_ANOAL
MVQVRDLLERVWNTVLKPPGGGSSDLFGSEQLSAAQIPRTMSKNRMQSNIFAAPSSSEAHKNGSETPRRAATGQDSHNRLFGEVDRPFTPSKNHMKSNLPIGGDQADGRKQQQNGKSNGVAHQNGNGTANGHHTNGHSNGNGNISSASSDNGSSHNQSTQQQQQQEQQTHQHHVPLHLQSMAGPGGIWAPRDPSGADPAVPLSPRRQPYFYPSGESLNPTYASHINLCISDDIIISVTEHDGEAPAGAYQLPSPHASPRSPRSPRFAQRNPVTGNGVEDYADKRKLSSRRGGAGAGDGNPVTGEGYSKSNGAAEINTTVPSLNGGGHVINKNRIPPGGFSSGLW